MAGAVHYGEKTFDDISMFGDNSNRVDDVMATPSIGQASIVRYRIPDDNDATINCMAMSCDFRGRLLSGAYNRAQDGAQIQVRVDSTIYYEQKFNWTGLSGYIGGADDYNSESEIMMSLYDMAFASGTVIDLYFTGKTLVRRMVYITIFGTLDDGTVINTAIRQAVDGTTATAISVYTVPSGRTLYLRSITISTRHIDLFAGKGYFVYNGIPVMVFDVAQTELGGVYGLVFPFYSLPMKETSSIGFRLDSYECGNEVIAASVYSTETPISSGGFSGVSRARVVNQ
jgi:hypothetical protein